MHEEEIRKYIRFFPEPLEIALIDTSQESFSKYNHAHPEMKTEYVALIENESHKGATLVFVLKEKDLEMIKDGGKWVVQLGKLAPLPAEVKWHKNLDTLIVKVGIVLLH